MKRETDKFKFWKLEPKPPSRDGRAWSLLGPAIFSAVGFFAFAVLAFSFTELTSLPTWFRTGLVLVGALCLAVGGEIGTLTTTVEIYRKSLQKKTIWWDWIGLTVSLMATLAEFLIAFATLLGVKAEIWSAQMLLWGPIALGLLSALDGYVNFMEFGLYLATYDQRMIDYNREYNRERKKFEKENGRRESDGRGYPQV
jgi:hypothetical protein